MLPNLTLRLPQVRRVQKQISDLIYLESGIPAQEVTLVEPTGEEHLFTVGLDKLKSLITLAHRIPILPVRGISGVCPEGISTEVLGKIESTGYYTRIDSNKRFDLLLYNDECAIHIPYNPRSNVDIMYRGCNIKQFVPNQNINLANKEFKVEPSSSFYFWKHFNEYSALVKASNHLAHIRKNKKTVNFPYMELVPASISYVFSLPCFNGNSTFLNEVNKILNNIQDTYGMSTPLKEKAFSTITNVSDKIKNIEARLIPLLQAVLPTVSLEDYINTVRLVEPFDVSRQHYSEKIYKSRALNSVASAAITDLLYPKEKEISRYWTIEKAMTTFDSPFTFKKHNQFHIDFMNLLVYGLKLLESNSSSFNIKTILFDPGYYNAYNSILNDGIYMRFTCLSIKVSKQLYNDIVKRVPVAEIDKPIFYTTPSVTLTVQTPEVDPEGLSSILVNNTQDTLIK